MSEQPTAEQRATTAAEALSAEGASVTARAVRQRSGVKMSVAADAARQWNQHQASQAATPDVPEEVQTRFEAAWRAAYAAATAEFDQARAGWQQRIDHTAAEQDALAEELDKAETQRDQALSELDAAREQAAAQQTEAAQQITEQRSRADKAEARAEAIEAERDRLLAERDTIRAEADQLKDQLRGLQAEPDNRTA